MSGVKEPNAEPEVRTVTFEEELARSGSLVYRTVGRSMLPLLRQGRDVVRIEVCDPQELRRYDAVLYRRRGADGRGAYVLHRILRRRPDGNFWIVGDNCSYGEIVAPGQILGRLTNVIRNGRATGVNDPAYRLYVHLWCAPWPLRFAALRSLRLMKRGARWLHRRLTRS